MREILFRGKRIDNGEWVEGFYNRTWLTNGEVITEIREFERPHHMQDFIEVDPSTVGQYTGLTDKNGKRIFEGDVVDAVRSGDETWRCVVSDIRKIPAEMCGSNVKSMDIVGNIHDNPELLEEEK